MQTGCSADGGGYSADGGGYSADGVGYSVDGVGYRRLTPRSFICKLERPGEPSTLGIVGRGCCVNALAINVLGKGLFLNSRPLQPCVRIFFMCVGVCVCPLFYACKSVCVCV